MRIAIARAESANSNDPRVGTLRPSFQRDLAFDATRVDQSRRSATVKWMSITPPMRARHSSATRPARGKRFTIFDGMAAHPAIARAQEGKVA